MPFGDRLGRLKPVAVSLWLLVAEVHCSCLWEWNVQGLIDSRSTQTFPDKGSGLKRGRDDPWMQAREHRALKKKKKLTGHQAQAKQQQAPSPKPSPPSPVSIQGKEH